MTKRMLSAEEAVESIEAIRSVMDRSTRYTHISWLGIVTAGGIACMASIIGAASGYSPLVAPAPFLAVWSAALVAAFAVGCLTTAAKARAARERFWSRKLHVVSLGFLPSLVLGFLLTALLADVGRLDLAPGIWMGMYGVGILAVGSVLDWEFQFTAWSFLLASATSLFLLRESPHLGLFLSFGSIHLALGAFRFRKEAPWRR